MFRRHLCDGGKYISLKFHHFLPDPACVQLTFSRLCPLREVPVPHSLSLAFPHPCLLYTLICELSPMKHLSDSHSWALNCTHHFRSVHLLQKGCLRQPSFSLKSPLHTLTSSWKLVLWAVFPLPHSLLSAWFSTVSHGSHASLPFDIRLEVGETMRNRNTWERLIMRIGASHCGNQEVLLSSRGKLETQESGCCNSDWLWRPENQESPCAVRAVQTLKVGSSHNHGQENMDVLGELNSPFLAYPGPQRAGCCSPSRWGGI